MVGSRTSLRAVVAALVVGGAGWVAVPSASSQVTELTPVTLSSSTFHDGDEITMSGTGCLDPETESGEGLVVVMQRPVDMGRGGTYIAFETIEAQVQPDGTYSGTATIGQPFFPAGPVTALVSCQRPGDEGEGATGISAREVEITMVPPALPDLVVQAGGDFVYQLPCSIEGGEYGFFGIVLSADGLPGVTLEGVRGEFPYENSPDEGDTVTIGVPADAAPGVYDAVASCQVSQAGTQAYFAGFTVTVTPADQAPAPPSASPTAVPTAAGAAPLVGAADYTG